MEIKVEANALISDLQKQFRSRYPFLKIEFYSGKEKLAGATTIDGQFSDTTINIQPKTTVSELENEFLRLLRIHAKVLRKAGTLWIPASLTHDWTLEKQNFEGEQMSIKVHD